MQPVSLLPILCSPLLYDLSPTHTQRAGRTLKFHNPPHQPLPLPDNVSLRHRTCRMVFAPPCSFPLCPRPLCTASFSHTYHLTPMLSQPHPSISLHLSPSLSISLHLSLPLSLSFLLFPALLPPSSIFVHFTTLPHHFYNSIFFNILRSSLLAIPNILH